MRSKSSSESLRAVGELEVVVEAVLDRRPDRDLHAGIELHHGGGEHVGGVVADEPEGVFAFSPGHDPDLGAVVERRGEVAQVAVHADAERRARQAGADRAGGVGAGGAVGELELGAVREVDLHGTLDGTGEREQLALERGRDEEALAHPLAAGPAHLGRQPGVAHELDHAPGQLLDIGGQEALHAVPDDQRQAAAGAPMTGVRFQSASQGARSKPSPSERSSTARASSWRRPSSRLPRPS